MTHAERKQQRIANAARKSIYIVTADDVKPGEELARFRDCAEAVRFAWDQVGPVVGNTRAAHVLWNRYPRRELTNYPLISVMQADAETGEIIRAVKCKQ